MSAEALAGFGRVVWADVELQRKLLAAPDLGGFVTLVTELARRRGWVDPGDVEVALDTARRDWYERWI